MVAYVVAFVLSGLNPFGGAFVSIPLGIYKLGMAPWLSVALTIPLVYVQVIVVDVAWDKLQAWPAWTRFLEKRRSPLLERILDRKDAALWLALLGPWIGCWLVTAAARFGGHRQSKVALPLLIGITYCGAIAGAICTFAPQWLPK